MNRHLLVIGAQRCGTTYLHAMLEAHPAITMARPARPEPKVFLADDLADRGVQWYRETWFAHATDESVWGEKSTSYLDHPEAAERAARMLGDATIVVMLRDPVRRAVSNWQFSTDHGMEDRPLAQALGETLDGPRAWDPARSSVSPYAYLERGLYADLLPAWDACFPASVLLLLFEEVVGQAPALAHLYDALGVDPGFVPAGLSQRVNQSRGEPLGLDADLQSQLRGYFAGSDSVVRERLGRALPWDDAADVERGAEHLGGVR